MLVLNLRMSRLQFYGVEDVVAFHFKNGWASTSGAEEMVGFQLEELKELKSATQATLQVAMAKNP